MAKDLTVVVAASGERKDITIEPGTSANDILRTVGLQGYVLSKDGSSASFFEGGHYQELSALVHQIGFVLYHVREAVYHQNIS